MASLLPLLAFLSFSLSTRAVKGGERTLVALFASASSQAVGRALVAFCVSSSNPHPVSDSFGGSVGCF